MPQTCTCIPITLRDHVTKKNTQTVEVFLFNYALFLHPVFLLDTHRAGVTAFNTLCAWIMCNLSQLYGWRQRNFVYNTFHFKRITFKIKHYKLYSGILTVNTLISCVYQAASEWMDSNGGFCKHWSYDYFPVICSDVTLPEIGIFLYSGRKGSKILCTHHRGISLKRLGYL